MALKKNKGKWRICIDFTNLNKACPKDSYPLPKIYQSVDAITRFERMSFLDTNSSYIQILMNEFDKIHIAFITEMGIILL